MGLQRPRIYMTNLDIDIGWLVGGPLNQGKERTTPSKTQKQPNKTKKNNNKCLFGLFIFCQLILLFNLFFVLFIGPTTLFGTIHRSHCTISTNI